MSGGFSEGIVTHFMMADLRGNRVEGTALRGISMTEMSMGKIEANVVRGARGVGVYCGDYSHCEIEDNTVVGTRPDPEAGVRSRLGYAIQANYYAWAEVEDNALSGNRARWARSRTGRSAPADGLERVAALEHRRRALPQPLGARHVPAERVGEPHDHAEERADGDRVRSASSETPAARTASASAGPTSSGRSVSFSRKPSTAASCGATGAVRQSAATASQTSSPSAYDATAPWECIQKDTG